MHHAYVMSTPDGHLGQCTCGDRAEEYADIGESQRWCDKHERKARDRRLNQGSKSPKASTSVAYFRERARMAVYTPEERAAWESLADELEAAQRPTQSRTRPVPTLPGQLGLFSDEPNPEERP